MKIVMPEFVLPMLEARACDLVEGARLFDRCETLLLEELGYLGAEADAQHPRPVSSAGDDAEVVVVPWALPHASLQRLLSPAPLRWVHTMTAGVEHVVRALPPGREVVITNAAGIFDVPIAEMVLALILAVVKRIPVLLAQQRAHEWRLVRLREIAGLSVGIIGLGSIGVEIARRCKAMGMHVIATRRHPERGAPFTDQVLAADQLPALLEASDFVVVAAPLTPETRGLIDAAALRQMRSDAWLINIARGRIVDQGALIQALQEGCIGGAALDVFDEEPLPPDSPLWEMPNVMVTPHNSWSTPHFKRREAELFLDNLERYLRGEPLRNVVDLSRGY
jgi:phosphoglycerate dehydrogenase-like enzyme